MEQTQRIFAKEFCFEKINIDEQFLIEEKLECKFKIGKQSRNRWKIQLSFEWGKEYQGKI